ncbi:MULTISPECIES: dihydroorotase [unclassified Brevundimonas]|uniref:dihydroorotase n=2 Tax=Brevundimonas TaxID=41275 RepID=UPI000CFA967B|nr:MULTISPECIES: dihydroorotase [unclassified Brevundimonas]PRA26432.1 dihydroorotase [Brevundimonas sp. MYb27]PQZ75873.1 dihydroorotase [Brevundimonas sp. MYb31]PRB11581.1 dihydroorotase [Brevundimonas sp. MYb52]PRB32723.1 dihydroorotase [Brevundimonas sp. MYb46]PRB45715.1 dihydroorotase [Brevundimonas sp. MYb33]
MTQTYDLIVRGGEVANHAGRGMADVGVIDGRIAFIGDLSQASAGEVFDATGLTVLPGVIDTQVHFREPGLEWKEDLETGSRAAALGGVVAVFEMPNTNPNTTDPETMADKLVRANNRMWTDHAFYVGGTHENADHLADLERLPGCCGVKVFMGASTGDLLIADDEGVRKVLSNVRRRATFHSEDEYRLVERRSLARTGDWTSHPEVRDAESAIMSTRRLVGLAKETGARIHVLHVTTRDEMEFLRFHKDVATVEITPQHLTLVAPEAYQRLGAYAQMNPPIRSQEHVDALWLWGMQQGVADVLGSDHAPHTKEEKSKPYPASPSGMPGVQTLVPLMLTHVANGRLSLERFIDLTSGGAQRVFGTANKGRMAVSYDADLTIVDLKAKKTITHDQQASRCGWTPFDGFETTGWPVATIVRGRVVMKDGELIGQAHGQPVRFQETLAG